MGDLRSSFCLRSFASSFVGKEGRIVSEGVVFLC